jgi:hypothetical protein
MIHQVGTDGVVPIHGERDFHFGPYAIDARNQNWIAQAAKVRAKQTAKAADFAHDLGSVRLPNERLDPALEFVAKIDIYARRCVGLCFSTRGFHKPLSIVSDRIGGRNDEIRMSNDKTNPKHE